MNYNPTPKSEFVKNTAAVDSHRSLVSTDKLHESLRVAMLEMSRRICNNAPADNMGACAAAHLRMLGAQDFVEIFLNLAETPAQEAKSDVSNLPGNIVRPTLRK